MKLNLLLVTFLQQICIQLKFLEVGYDLFDLLIHYHQNVLHIQNHYQFSCIIEELLHLYDHEQQFHKHWYML